MSRLMHTYEGRRYEIASTIPVHQRDAVCALVKHYTDLRKPADEETKP